MTIFVSLKKGAQVHDFLGILSWTFSTFKTFKGAEKNEKLNSPGLLYTVHYVEFTLPSAPRPFLLPLPPPPGDGSNPSEGGEGYM